MICRSGTLPAPKQQYETVLMGEGILNAYFDAMRRYFDFKGRASRSEFWCFTLIVLAIAVLGLILDLALDNGEDGPLFITALVVIPHYIPVLAASVRRLHDIDRTGWWVLIGVIPLGQLILLIFYCLPSTPGANRFGSGGVGNAPQSPIQPRQQANATESARTLINLNGLLPCVPQGRSTRPSFSA